MHVFHVQPFVFGSRMYLLFATYLPMSGYMHDA